MTLPSFATISPHLLACKAGLPQQIHGMSNSGPIRSRLRRCFRRSARRLASTSSCALKRQSRPHCGRRRHGHTRATHSPILAAISVEPDSGKSTLLGVPDALVCINMIHITPWAASKGLMTGAERTLRSGGVLYLYGPYQINGRHTAQSNQEFDAWLRTQNAQRGVRDIAGVTDLAHRHGFSLAETIPMPANNLSAVFERSP